ncbi:alpha/beta hydrolase [Hyphomonas sp.]|uniref:alpha/beta hydrolase n=1 Tax=Hyphomonas sp. TaxID=87 RepID=UPI003528692D
MSDPYDWRALHARRMAALAPHVREKLEARVAFKPFEEMGVVGFRSMMDDYTSSVPPSPVPYEDVSVPGPAGPIPTRIFKPNGANPEWGACLYLHGGGFIGGGGLDGYSAACGTMAEKTGCVVVFPDFRLPPEHKFPASVEDCWAVAQWMGDNGAAYGFNPDRIAVGGGCTGATHATVVALMARDAGRPRIVFQWLFDAFLDARGDYQSHEENGEGYQLSEADNQYIIRRYLSAPQERWDWRVSPVLAPSLRGAPPTLIVASEFDILRDEMAFYANRLADAGVDVDFRCYPMEGHSFSFGEDETQLSDAGRDAKAALLNGLRKALKGAQA